MIQATACMDFKHLLSEGSQTQKRTWGMLPFLYHSTATGTCSGGNQISGCLLFVYMEGCVLARDMREISRVIEMFCVLIRVWGKSLSVKPDPTLKV